MEVVRITPRGYCHGVVDAFRIAKRVREETNGPVHMLGMLVHNTHATDDLQAQGIALVDPPDRLAGLEQIKDGTVIFTAHGVSPQVKQRAVGRGLTAIDATCSDVVRTHELVADLAGKGYEVVYNEICRATQERQEAAVEAAAQVDVVIVVGSPRSSNSLRLVEVVKKLGRKPAYLVDRLEDLDLDWLKGAKKVGVTSGASTPSQLTRRVIEYIEALESPA